MDDPNLLTPDQATRVAAAFLSKDTAALLYATAHKLTPDDIDLAGTDQHYVTELHNTLLAIAARAASSQNSHSALARIQPAEHLPFDTPTFVTAGFKLLAEAVGTARGDWNHGAGDLTANTGAEPYENDARTAGAAARSMTKNAHQISSTSRPLSGPPGTSTPRGVEPPTTPSPSTSGTTSTGAAWHP